MRIVKAVQTSFCLPSAWNAWTDTGEELRLKYRRGKGVVWRTSDQLLVLHFHHGHPLAGEITLERFAYLAGLGLAADIDRTDLLDPNEDLLDRSDEIPPWSTP